MSLFAIEPVQEIGPAPPSHLVRFRIDYSNGGQMATSGTQPATFARPTPEDFELEERQAPPPLLLHLMRMVDAEDRLARHREWLKLKEFAP